MVQALNYIKRGESDAGYTEKPILAVKSSVLPSLSSPSKPRFIALLLFGLVIVGGAWLARPYIERRQIKNASLPQLEAMANRDVNDAEVLAELGRRLVRAGQTQRGSLALMRVSQLRPDDAEIWNDLGYCMMTLGQEVEARAAFERALQITGKQGEVARRTFLGLGQLDVTKGRDRPALESYRAAMRLNGDDVDAQMALGRTAARLNLPAEAATAFRRVTQMRPADHAGFLALGQALVDAGNSEEGEIALRKALQLKLRDYQTLHGLGVLYLRRDDGPDTLRKSVAYFKEALKENPHSALSYSMLGSAEEKLGLLSDAAQHIETSRRLDPSGTRVYYRLSQIYARMGRTADAARMTALFTKRRRLREEEFNLVQRLSAVDHPPASGLLHLANVKFQLNDYRGALKYLNMAANEQPGNERIFQAYLALANSLNLLKQSQLAEAARQGAARYAAAQQTAQQMDQPPTSTYSNP